MIIVNVPPKRGRPSGRDTIQTRLAEPASTEIPSPKFLVPAVLREFGKETNVYPSSRNPLMKNHFEEMDLGPALWPFDHPAKVPFRFVRFLPHSL